MHDHVDALIVGGGPAGALAALRLAKLRWRVLLVERGERDHSKTCGHCLNARALALLRGVGLEARVRRLALGPTSNLAVHLNGHRLDVPISINRSTSAEPGSEGVVVDRGEFDQLLRDEAQRAGAIVIQPATARVVRLDSGSSAVEVADGAGRHVVHAQLVIGADGLGSAIARAAGLAPRARARRRYGFSFDIDAREPGHLAHGSVEMFMVHGGYLGVVRGRKGGLHVAAMAPSGGGAGGGGEPFAFIKNGAAMHPRLQSLGLADLSRADVRNFCAAGPMPWRPRQVANAAVALVGDAAGYVEPFTGEGMSWALESADALADAVSARPAGDWSERTARQYRRTWRDRVGRRQRMCTILAAALARPGLASLLFRAGQMRPALARRMVAQAVAP